MKRLDSGFSVEIDMIDQSRWSAIIQEFNDATIFQTWEYGSHSWGKKNLSHLVLKKDAQIVAAVQVRIYLLPFLSKGFAHISWGPMWRHRLKDINLQIFKNLLRALRNHYSIERKLLLRIRINEIQNENSALNEILVDEGFQLNEKQHKYRTIRLNLTPSLEEIRKNFKKKWRARLNKAEREDISVVVSRDPIYFDKVSEIHNEMVKRKKFTRYIADAELYKKIQNDLDEHLKMQIFLSWYQDEIMGCIAVAIFGNTGMPMLGSITAKSIKLKLDVAYILHWKIIQWLKENGFKFYDLRGYDPEKYPGPSEYKAGLSGDDIRFMGTYESFTSIMSAGLVRIGEMSDTLFQQSMSLLRTVVNKISGLQLSPADSQND